MFLGHSSKQSILRVYIGEKKAFLSLVMFSNVTDASYLSFFFTIYSVNFYHQKSWILDVAMRVTKFLVFQD